MLPVPYDQPLIPIYQYPQNNPPIVPPIQVHPEGAQLLVAAAALTANALGAAADTSAVRMFCYNLMCKDNWNSPDFFNIVRLVVDYTVFRKMTGGAGNVFVTLQQTATEMATLYASYNAMQYQEFFALLDPVTQQRVFQNEPMFKDYTMKADSVYQMQAQPQHMQHPGQLPQSLNMGHRPHVQHATFHGHQPVRNAYPQQTFQAGGNPAASGLSAGIAQAQSRDTFVSTKFGTVPRATPPQVPPTRHSTNQGDTMDRNLHQIAYRSNVITVPPKNQKIVNAQKKVENSAPPPIVKLSVENVQEVARLTELSMETAIQSIESEMSGKMKQGEVKISPYVVTVLNPFISSVETGNLFERLREAKTFSTVREALIEYRNILNEAGRPENWKYFGLIWLKRIDAHITKIANEYFMNTLPSGGFRIGGVMEDGGDIQNYISTTYQTKANPSFNIFQRNLFSEMFGMDVELPDLDEKRPVDYENLAIKHLVVHLATTLDEMNLGGLSRPVDVRKETGSLFDVLFLLNKTAKQEKATRTNLVTLDGKKLVFWESATDPNVFTIYEE